MDQAQIEAKIAEWRAKCPEMFSHPGARVGEMWVMTTSCQFQVAIYRSAGLHSARFGDPVLGPLSCFVDGVPKTIQVDFCPVFVQTEELAKFKFQDEAKKR